MPGSAVKCFKNDSNEFKSSKDYIEKKKAETIYYNRQDNTEQEYKGPIIAKKNGCLGAVGGYNTKNYDLKLNILKGSAYSIEECIKLDNISKKFSSNKNKLCNTKVESKCRVPISTYELFEGPFLLKNSINSSEINCTLKELKLHYSQFDASNIDTNSFNKLINNDKLINLYLNSKIPLISKTKIYYVNEVPLFWNNDSVLILNGIAIETITQQNVPFSNTNYAAFYTVSGATETLNEVLITSGGTFINSGLIIEPSSTPAIIEQYKNKIKKYILKNFSIDVDINNIEFSTDYKEYTFS